MTSYSQIGKAVGRAEGPEKVSGATLYPADVKLPGMLVGRCLRSPYPHARIVSIDAGEAEHGREQVDDLHRVIDHAAASDHRRAR